MPVASAVGNSSESSGSIVGGVRTRVHPAPARFVSGLVADRLQPSRMPSRSSPRSVRDEAAFVDLGIEWQPARCRRADAASQPALPRSAGGELEEHRKQKACDVSVPVSRERFSDHARRDRRVERGLVFAGETGTRCSLNHPDLEPPPECLQELHEGRNGPTRTRQRASSPSLSVERAGPCRQRCSPLALPEMKAALRAARPRESGRK